MTREQRRAPPMEPTAAIASLPLFARLRVGDVRALAASSTMRRFPAGGTIFRQGAQGDSLHVILQGSVRVAVTSPAGGEVILAVLREGECLGELAIIDAGPRSASALAQEPTATLVVTRRTFLAWLGEHPAVALPLLETLAARLRAADEALSDVAFLDLGQRLAKRLLALADGPTGDGRATVDITQDALAAMLGVSRESVNKQLNSFARQGWVELHRGAVVLADPPALRRLQAGEPR